MNLELHNFHTRASGTVTGQSAPRSTSLPHTSASLNILPKRANDTIQHCRSWNDGACRWSLGQCRYCHICERCDGQHPLTNCTFQAYKGSERSRSLGENAVGVNNKVALQITAPSCVNSVSSSLTVPCSTFALTGVDSQQKIGLHRSSCSFNDSYLSALALPLHQPLLPFLQSFSYKSGKIKQGNAHTSRSIFCNLCLGRSSEWVSCWFRPCFGLLKIGHTEYALC